MSSNRIEWVEFDIAIMSCGAITVPSFVTNNIEDNKFIINDSKPKIIILENEKTYKNNLKFLSKFNKSKIITIEECDLFMNHKKILSKKIHKIKTPEISKDDIATIIYTSGTSANPKGVVLSHKALLHNLEAAFYIIIDFEIYKERFLSFLPLSHSYERMAGLYFPLLVGGEIYFCSSLERLLSEIKEVRPTIFSAVPRLYENIFKKFKNEINKSGNFKKLILRLIFGYIENNSKSFYKIFLGKIFVKIFIKKKLMQLFGGNIKALISGGAALNPTVGFFFNKAGLKLLQGYGQTEAAPLISCNFKNSNDPRTVGFPVKNVEIKISNDNEILVKGDNVMLGYWNNKKLTNQTIRNKWLYTGDLGFLDKDGRLVINGRKKDLIVTSGGDNISVQKIETILTAQVEISQAVIYGDNKPFLIALIVLDKDCYPNDLKSVMKKINNKLNSIEKIRKFIIIDKPFTYENGLLTQTQKIKRKKVYLQFSNQIKNLY